MDGRRAFLALLGGVALLAYVAVILKLLNII